MLILACLEPFDSRRTAELKAMSIDPSGPAWDLSIPILRISYVTPGIARIVDDLVDFDCVRDILRHDRAHPAVILHNPGRISGHPGILAEPMPLWMRMQEVLGREFANACSILLKRRKRPNFEPALPPAALFDPRHSGPCDRVQPGIATSLGEQEPIPLRFTGLEVVGNEQLAPELAVA